MSVYFEKELLMIENEEMRNLVIETLKNVKDEKDEFYHAPASSTGKYHPDYALGDGGLYRHTEAAVKIAHDLLDLEWYQNLFDEITSGIEWRDKYT